jgi:hypothetical protein
MVFILSTTLFMFSLLVITIGMIFSNVIIMGIGIVLSGMSDCLCFIIGLTLAGCWRRKGVGMFNAGQSLTVAISVMVMIFLPYYGAIIWMVIFYIWNVVGLLLYSKKIKGLIKSSIILSSNE